jgi:lysophospholipase L1-like esterase
MWARPKPFAIGLGISLVFGTSFRVHGGGEGSSRELEGSREPSTSIAPAASPVAEVDSAAPRGRSVDGSGLTPALFKLRAGAQARILGQGSEIEDADGAPRPAKKTSLWRANGDKLGVSVPVENEPALRSFHAALARLERGELPGGKVRVLAYGASHTQADIYTGYLRYYLQSRFGDGGPGFVQMAQIDDHYGTTAFDVSSRGFAIQHAQRDAARASGWFGLLGAAAVGASPAARAGIRARSAVNAIKGPAQIEIFTMGHPKGGEMSLLVDGAKWATWSTRVDLPRSLVHSSEIATGFSALTVRPAGNGPVRLFGVAVERPTPGVVVDTLGIRGSRAASWLRWDEATWAEQVKRRDPYLVTLAYGTNETSDETQPIAHYERDLDLVLARLRRAAPRASCVLIGPGDAWKKKGEAWVRRPRLKRIIEVQRRKASEHGCGFWDTLAFMGQGGMERWVAASPPMASSDRIHLTRRGYVKMGLALGDALLRAYDAAL